ncbi:hypothetical protein KIL84_001636 [Mauremys mutica]|uniref:Uncharacterized protein n=1 Tax=Mauremys mutica TaxID=74926 RepID=A0A9D4AY08_9SAUR|nr:hypothetical protein KIL84_001636 [Mauremys mutica]
MIQTKQSPSKTPRFHVTGNVRSSVLLQLGMGTFQSVDISRRTEIPRVDPLYRCPGGVGGRCPSAGTPQLSARAECFCLNGGGWERGWGGELAPFPTLSQLPVRSEVNQTSPVTPTLPSRDPQQHLV